MVHKTHIEISLVLPEVPDARDACVQRLRDLLEAKDGVDAAHVMDTKDRPNQLCIHHDPQRLSIADVRELARRAGAALHERFGHLLLKTKTMHARRARTLAGQIDQMKGILETVASPNGLLRIEFDRDITDETTIRATLQNNGIPIVEERSSQPVAESETAVTDHEHDKEPDHDQDGDHKHGGLFGDNSELIFAAICGAALLTGWLLSVLTAVNPWVPWCLYVASFFFGGFFTVREAIENIRAKRFEIDFLMLVAAAGAASLGEWAEGALLLFLFSIGHALEHYAMGRASRAIEALAELAPQKALVKRDGNVREVPIEQLQIGDVVVVKPDQRISADGFVVNGESSVNQAPITGESIPVDKRPVSDRGLAAEQPEQLTSEFRVFAGTINESGALEIYVTKLASENTLARVVEMVNEAETQTSPTQQFTDQFERYFVPTVLGFIVLLLFAWVVIDEPFSRSFYRAMAVLVAASPCALAIATPSAVLSGVARAARGGVLVKGGGPLERLGRLDAIAFDKTGTLTEGKPALTDIVPASNVSEAELLRIAIAVEELSDHPLAAAVVRGGRERLEKTAASGQSPPDSQVPAATDLQSMTGRGIKAEIDGKAVYIGKDDLFAEVDGPELPEAVRSAVERLEKNGRTTTIVRHGDRYLGVLGLMDTPRAAAKQVISRLHELGVKRMIMISGDNQQVADAVAAEVGLDEARGDLMPNDKVDAIRQLRESGGVAMVGDGVNDAPAMANASVGIAMGAAGSDVALETADVALMADDLNHLPFAVGLSRQTSRIIRQNLWFSLGMVAILIPATLYGLQMGAAVILHEGSTLLVVFNALRLLRYSEERPLSPAPFSIP